MNIIPFEPAHVARLRVQSRQARLLSYLVEPYIEALGAAGPAMTAQENGEILACAGIAEQGFGVGTLWAFIAADAGRRFLSLHRGARRLIQLHPLRRLEATTECDFPQGCRWLELLGFKSEGLLHAYGPDGADHYRYALWQ